MLALMARQKCDHGKQVTMVRDQPSVNRLEGSRSMGSLADCLTDWSNDWLIGWLVDWLVDWLIG